MKTNHNGIRLNRFISMCGICSRRKADQLILEGRVKINNTDIAKLGTKIFSNDIVLVDGRQIYLEKKKYILRVLGHLVRNFRGGKSASF